MSENQDIKKQSKLGLFSFWLGILNIFILFIVIHQIAQFLMNNPELVQNPAAIDGMRISQSTYDSFIAVFLLQFLGLVLGMVALFRRGVKRLFPIFGTIINGVLATISALKLII